MRFLALILVMAGLVATSAMQARAQTYDPAFPVCAHVVPLGGGSIEDCTYYTMDQCRMSASGRAAYCIFNPYFGGAMERSKKNKRRLRRAH